MSMALRTAATRIARTCTMRAVSGIAPRTMRPHSQLIAAATAHRSDVILMGTHGRTGLARLVIGSVARNVLHHAPCSVLVVREQKAANTHKTGQSG